MVDNTTAAFLDVINTMSMKLKRISLPNDRMLSNDEMKFVVGGGDDVPEFEGGTLPEAVVYAPKRGGHEHEGDFSDCQSCQNYLRDLQRTANNAAGGNSMDNEIILNMQMMLVAGRYVYHYLSQ